ncbi:hypothetical protein FTO74_12530 [Granulicella sp. WH15]|uniref:hypothetical protein n=1 Tax=Granulicella sp. WH15 TaxID=2602070 RepID=UPI001367361B|nr:hypothetical protein [Granulicella sp. WH15]QHN04104.1 hypothetical protein FTO74_12530 [Granulicella sp. WH15]
MTGRNTAVGFGLLALALALPAQTPHQVNLANTPLNAPTTSPEHGSQSQADQAFSAAKEIEDPKSRVEAFQKFLKDYPDTRSAHDLAGGELIDAAVAGWPNDLTKAVALAKETAASATGMNQVYLSTQFAVALLDKDMALPDAETFAHKAFDGLSYPLFADGVHKTYATAIRPPIEGSIENLYRTAQAHILTILGQICVKENKTSEGQKFLEQSLEKNAYSTETAHSLAELAAASGDKDKELAYRTQGYLAHANKADRTKLEALYRAAHNGSLDGLEPYLDTQYRKDFPKQTALEEYAGTPHRTVLLELLTGSKCPPCLGMDMAFDQLLERYPRRDVAVLMYHQNRAGPDPMTNYPSLATFAYYTGVSAPTTILAGHVELGGGFAERSHEFALQLSHDVDEQLAIPAEADFTLKASEKGHDIPVSVQIKRIQSTSNHLTLKLAVVDKLLTYSGETGVRFHPMVVRTTENIPLTSTKPQTIEHTFNQDQILADIKKYHDDFEKGDDKDNVDGTYRWPIRLEKLGGNGLAVAAFIQDDDTKKVLQAGWVDLSRAPNEKIVEAKR